MDGLLKKILDASGISGYEKEITGIMQQELKKSCSEVIIDNFGNVIARKGKGKKKIMIAAHMDEVGFLVKHIGKEGFINFIKVGGIDDRILLGQRVVIKTKKGDIRGIIGAKPPHLMKDDEGKRTVKYEDMFIDIGCKNKEEAMKKVEIADSIIFDADAGTLNGELCYGKAIDDRVGCYALIKMSTRSPPSRKKSG
jgi:putative aminopeptidase FrvX